MLEFVGKLKIACWKIYFGKQSGSILEESLSLFLCQKFIYS